MRPRRINQWLLLVGLSFAVLLAGTAYYAFLVQARPLLRLSTPQMIDLRPGMSLRSLSLELDKYEMSVSPKLFEWWGRLHGVSNHLKSGEYAITPGMTATELLSKMVSGDVVLHRITFVEGWTVRQIIEAMNHSGLMTPGLEGQDGLSRDLAVHLGRNEAWMEGRFLPNTYFFVKGEVPATLLKRANEAMMTYLSAAWEKRDPIPLKSMDDVLIVASIIEKESAIDSERPLIAAVIYNRLRLKMRLQLDPTVIYGLGDAYAGTITKAHLLKKSPYNTYKISGLPPSPISCPSTKSIDAALHPEKSSVLYFVAQGDGSHVFSSTLAEHQQAVIRYRQNKQSLTQKNAKK